MRPRIPLLLSLLVSLFLISVASADVRLPSIVGDGMVLQRDAALKIWGWADPGESVSVAFRKQQLAATADADGKWMVRLEPLSPGGPDTMEIQGHNSLLLRDIYVGDVWVASGQSNMTHNFGRWQERYATEIAASANPAIRQFRVPTQPVLTGPQDDFPGLTWKESNPENLLDFTVIGYFFAKKLHDRYGVPQGIIMSCVGGTIIEAWTSAEGFRDFPDQLATIERNLDTAYVDRVNAEAQADRESDGPRVEADRGLTGDVKWFDPAYEPQNWKRINVPGYWEDQGVRDLDGVVWYRREIDVPAAMTGMDALAKLGRIRNADEIYVNGQRIGNTTYEYPQRRYTIPAGVLQPGKNLFVIRVINQGGKGGFIPDKPYQLIAADQSIDLKGDWDYKVGEAYAPRRSYKWGINAQGQPASLYNGMIAPFTNFGVRGLLWYQGESNAGNPAAYRRLLPNLIADWRAHWDMGALPFLIAQLPNFQDVDYLPAESNWALMREAQLETALTTPRTGLGINIDLGEWNDIHPGDKKPVGERLALQAMRISYGDDELVASGPIFRSQEIKDGEIVLHFDHVGSGLMSNKGETLAHFAIAGEDQAFIWGHARIDGDTVVVWHEDLPAPKYVRYAWADNPDFANLANREGLPASPFRTDD
ncbi:sialate O-acetylesterase [Synoicihabitans lomoniglobus]|uniref:Sialate O-acetylesterase n=1 Tax=Synoicihabitans lomoniglobus TaxID=2909285 RepID=A0AAE9ZZG9_9BACT|nr:hypothetical protein [Opitutaceae bacterium LMO-M01]WED65678.1 sialate O-acetylesterase [Opitutaceae bacterium LMO-M01]